MSDEQQSQIDRLDVADFNRRLDAFASRMGDLATAIAVQTERESQKAIALMAALKAREANVDHAFTNIEIEMKGLKDAFATGKGAIWVLCTLGGLATFLMASWEKLMKLFH